MATATNEEVRADPDQILKSITEEEKRMSRGHLHIFFGYAAGVGKTYAMLKEAHSAYDSGIDVVVGYVEPHMRPETSALLEGLEALPTKQCNNGRIIVREFDLDAALARKPELILVDELAHTNAPGCRHTKRYQDVEELLAAGIDVYTTVNAQHLESLNDMVASITGVIVRERIPDRIFFEADRVKLVDIEPEELLERLKEGKVYREAQAKQATSNFFTLENLTALRELALRCCADRVNRLSEAARAKSGGDYYTDEHILVCISPSPTNAKIIRSASRMATIYHATFTALFVETPEFTSITDENMTRLRSNMHLAQQLGAKVETVYGDDVAYQIGEFARQAGVSKIVIGRSSAKKGVFKRKSLNDRLLDYAPNLDVYVIPDQTDVDYHEKGRQKVSEKTPVVKETFISILILVAATAIGFLFYNFGLGDANIITVYILGVLMTAVLTSKRVYSLVSSILSVVIFNFCFIDPRFTMSVYDTSYIATFIIMFIAAFISSSLAVQLKQHAKQSSAVAYRTRILVDTSDMLLKAKTKEAITEILANQLLKLLHRDVIFYLPENGNLSKPMLYSHDDSEEVPEKYYSRNEQAVAAWVLKNNKRAGATTDTLSSSKCLYLAIRVENVVYGVVGIALDEDSLGSFEYNILISILGEGALAYENDQAYRDSEKAAVVAKNEQLRANLLRSISHDLRTPLTSISGNANILMTSSKDLSEEKKLQLYNNIYDDSQWLTNLVENVLSVTRIEDGKMNLKMADELLNDIIEEALKHVSRDVSKHDLHVYLSDDLLLVKVDSHLIMQVIINMVDNSIKHTQEGSTIIVRSYKHGKHAVVTVADNGPGIPDVDKPHIFDMFYTVDKTPDSSRSLGIGLALCKSIIEAHNGTITVKDNHPVGTLFTVTLPLEEVEIHE